jgi:peptidoglycan pentaglycine glycine transferase (the first glycine)
MNKTNTPTLKTITHQATWNPTISALPHHHILQAWEWGDFKSRWGWTPTRMQWEAENGKVVAAAQLLRRAIPRTPFGIGYVPKGPLFDDQNLTLAETVLTGIEAEARRQRCLFVKIDPDVLAANGAFTNLLVQRGWVRGEPIQFPNTGVVDVSPDEEMLLANMKQKWRYNIRLAERRGVVIQEGVPTDFPTFYRLYAETAKRDGFLIRPEAYYLDVWQDFHTKGLAHLLLATVENEAVAGMVLFRFGTRVWYFYGASSDRHRDAMPNHALQWAAMRWAKSVGATDYDLWGAPDDLNDPDDGMAGVWRFKIGFNPEFRAQIGAWDFPVNRLAYRLYTEGIPRVRALLRRGGGGSAPMVGG